MVLEDSMRIFRVSRPSNNQNYSDFGYNSVVVVAKNENQAKGIALASTSSLIDSPHYKGSVTKKDLIIEEITDELEIGYVIAKE